MMRKRGNASRFPLRTGPQKKTIALEKGRLMEATHDKRHKTGRMTNVEKPLARSSEPLRKRGSSLRGKKSRKKKKV